MAKIIIQRKSFAGGAMCTFDVYLMNQYVGELKNGGTLQFDANVGTHLLEFKAKLRINKMADTSFSVVVNDPNEVVMLNAGFKMSGKFSVEYADGQQRIPTYTMSFSNSQAPAVPSTPSGSSTSNASSTQGAPSVEPNTVPQGTPVAARTKENVATPQAPVVTSVSDDGKRKSSRGQKKSTTNAKSKKSGKKMGCLVPIVVLVVLFSIGSLFMGGDDVSDDDSSQSSQSEQQKNKVLYSDDNFKISMAGFEDNDAVTSFTLVLDIQNKSDKKVMVTLDDGYLNDEGVFTGSGTPVEIAPGKKKTGGFVIGYGDTSIESIDEVKKLEFTVVLYDDDMNEVLNTGNITVNMK